MLGESREDKSPHGTARGISVLERSCADAALTRWYAGEFPDFLARCGDHVLEVAGPDETAGVILLGSFATSEGAVAILDGRPVILSDIDLLLVVRSRETHAKIYPRRALIALECERLLPDAVFSGRVDLGVITQEELSSMPRSPGVFDMRESGVFLSGGELLREMMPRFSPGDIGPAEALRLLENRAASFLGCRPGTGGGGDTRRLERLYGMSRVYTDILTASLCVRGLYASGYDARKDILLRLEEGAALREGLGDSLIEDIVRWTLFKIDPTEEETWTEADTLPRAWLAGAGDLLAAIDLTAGMVSVEEMPARISPASLRRMWMSAGAGVMACIRGTLAGKTPDQRAREGSVRLLRHAAERGTGGRVGSAPGGYPFGRSSWEDAAAAAWSAWSCLVSGREEGGRG